MDVINFYSVSDEFGQFSNFAPFPIVLDGQQWPTSEHYFQAQKFTDESYREKIGLPEVVKKIWEGLEVARNLERCLT